MPDPARPGRLRRIVKRLGATNEELEARELLRDAVRVGTPIASVPVREKVTVSGTLRSVTLRPRAGVPALEAELYDGSGVLSIIWLGRRQMAGIVPGRDLMAEGRISDWSGRRVMFNPRYQLRPADGR